MSTPYDPGDRSSDQPGYPPAPPPGQQPQGQPPQGQPPQGGYAGDPSGGQFPPAPDYGSGQPYGSAPAYGSAPQYGDPYGGPAAPVNPPKEVVWATYAMYAAIALSLISLLFTLLDSEGYKDAIRESNTNPDVDVDAVYAGVVVFAIVLTLLISALYVFLAVNLKKGKNWARITTWVVVGLFTLLGLIGLGGDTPGMTRLISILVLLANAATLALLALKPSNEFFAAHRAPRR